MRMTFGAFVENYRSQSIFWDGSYNLDGSGSYRTIGEARQAVDRQIQARIEQEEQERMSNAQDSSLIRIKRNGDTCQVTFPDGSQISASVRQVRRDLFNWEEQYQTSVAWI